jgi:hypothetical protein
MIKAASVAAFIGALLVMPAAAEAHKLSKARAAKAAAAGGRPSGPRTRGGDQQVRCRATAVRRASSSP